MKGLKASFDEATYLAAHPDVAAGVRAGAARSGWVHYLAHGVREGRRASIARDARYDYYLSPKNWPATEPPEHLKVRVHGAPTEGFGLNGRLVALDMDQALVDRSLQNLDGARVLDFGCGCGRTLPWFKLLYPNAQIEGADIDAEAIEWCRQNLSGSAQFRVNELEPPLSYRAEHFDLVYSISIFTHLPEDMQFRWLDELRRVTKRGGHLLLTVAGEHDLPPGEKFLYRTGQGTKGLPSFYQVTLHSEAYVRERWSKFFEIRAFFPRAINDHQDLVVCRVWD